MKLKDIKGCLVEKYRGPCLCGETECDCHLDDDRFNQAIDQQGEVEITLNRENLASEIAEDKIFSGCVLVGLIDKEHVREISLRMADAIISKLDQIVEVVKKEGKV